MTAPLWWAVVALVSHAGVALATWVKAGGGTTVDQRIAEDQQRRAKYRHRKGKR